MTFKQLKYKIKEEQKSLAQKIKELKSKRKESQYGLVYGLWGYKDDFRHIHIAYCKFFNKTPYDMIEKSCYENPRKHTIENHMKSWESQIDEEALRNCA